MPAHKDATGYVFRFPVQIKDGVLAGQNGIPGQPGSLTLSGTVRSDGTASIDARGMTRDPKYTVSRLSSGSPYAYHVDARFEGSRGTGTLTFVR